MNTNFLKKTGIITAGTLGAIYGLFLLAPFVVSPIANSYLPMLNSEIKKATGLCSDLEGFRVVTTPKLTVGAKFDKFVIKTPEKKEVFAANDFEVKMSLIPLLAKKIEVDLVRLNSLDLNLNMNSDGSFEVEKYFPKQKNSAPKAEKIQTEPIATEPIVLPFGLRLSNHLPDIKINGYDIKFIDNSTSKVYQINGDKTEITDFVFNKNIKVLAKGKVVLADREQFIYDIKVNNKIMPDMNLHDLIFNPQPVKTSNNIPQSEVKINVLEILKGIYNNKVTAKLATDLVLSKNGNNGYVKLENLSIAPSGLELPASDAHLSFKGHKIDVNSNFYTAQNEVSTIFGNIQTGKNPKIDLNLKSDVQLNNIIKIINAIAMIFDIKDLQTLSANGSINADFNIKSDLKSLSSNGYFRIPNAQVKYGLYNVSIDDINSDIVLNDNNIKINNIGFSILEQPLKFHGSISKDAIADLHLVADRLGLKGLLIAFGQAALLKDNQVNSGTITLNADIVGRLDSIKPTAKILLSNVDIKSIPANTAIKLPNTTVDIISDGKSFAGTAQSNSIKIINPAATVSIPKVSANISPDIIEITQTPVAVEKINFNISGKIKNYLTEKINLDFVTVGDIKSTLKGDLNILKQTLNLVYATTSDSTIIVPMFDKSKLTFNCNISIGGNMLNPILSGVVNVPTMNIPEIPVTMDNLVAKLNGEILNGHASVARFSSGGIVAENLTSNFSMKGENFYLSNLKGSAFDGKIGGNIIYNLNNTKTNIDFKGEGLNAEKAVAGAVGIKNALSGTLGFDTKLSLLVLDYEDMMRSLTGNLSFKITDGSFGNIGRIENFFGADNIVSNSILKTTVATLSNLSGIKNTAKYDYITGEMSFANGWANLKSIKSAGQTLAYYVCGKFNLINMTTNVTVLGRLDSSVVALLGPIGELSADKLFSYIPKFGNLTANLVKVLTTNPKGEKVSEIPALSNGSNNYKDFKVSFNGGLESASSVKSFKWLTDVDTTAIEQKSVSETIKSLKDTVDTDLTNTVQGVVDTVKTQKEALKNTADELKNLFKF